MQIIQLLQNFLPSRQKLPVINHFHLLQMANYLPIRQNLPGGLQSLPCGSNQNNDDFRFQSLMTWYFPLSNGCKDNFELVRIDGSPPNSGIH